MKNWLSLLFAAVVLLCVNVAWTSAAAASGASAPNIYLDGKRLTASVSPYIEKSSVVVPIRTIAENLGYKVGYDTKKRQVRIQEGTTTVLMTINQSEATVNGRPMTLPVAPVLKSSTTMVPLRFVGETFGLGILWEHGTRSVYLTKKPGNQHADTGSKPDGGDLIGVVDGPNTDNLDGYIGGGADEPDVQSPPPADPDTNPGADPGADPVTDPDANPVTDPDANPVTDPDAQASQAHLKQIFYEQDTVVIQYAGLLVPATNVLTGPDRIVIDLPKTDYAADFVAGGAPIIPAPGQIAELAVDGHEALKMVRFSQYETEPYAARIVLDLNQRWNFQLSNDFSMGELRIQLKKPVSVQPGNKVYTVVLDAGHGGSDPGARSIVGRWEKEFTLIMAKKVQALLKNDSRIKLVMTRQTDVYPSLDDRVNLANSIKADMFISIHGNSFTNGANGTETFYSRANSAALAKVMHRNILSATKFQDRGVRTAGYKVIKYTTMPAVLLEIGFLSHLQNAQQMYNDAFQNRVAQAIATSIKQYYKLS